MNNTRRLVYAAVIAGLYAALCYALQPFAFGAIQFRVAEALTLLPLLFPSAVPGLFIGCILANFTSPFFMLDVVFGSLATLLAAVCTYQIGKRIKNKKLALALAPLPPILANTFIVGGMLTYTFSGTPDSASFIVFAGQIFISEGVICYVFGIPLILALKKLTKKNVVETL